MSMTLFMFLLQSAAAWPPATWHPTLAAVVGVHQLGQLGPPASPGTAAWPRSSFALQLGPSNLAPQQFGHSAAWPASSLAPPTDSPTTASPLAAWLPPSFVRDPLAAWPLEQLAALVD